MLSDDMTSFCKTFALLLSLLAVLGFHGMLNQPQYHHAFVEGKDLKGSGGFLGMINSLL